MGIRIAGGKDPKPRKKPAKTDEVVETSEANRFGVYLFAMALFVIGFAVTFFATFAWVGPITVIVAAVVGALLSSCIRVAAQWERVVILHLGRFRRIAGPGIYLTVPFIESIATRVDQRVRIMSFSAEAALTRDLVPVDIDAVIFWMVWDAKKACWKSRITPKPSCGPPRRRCATP